MQKARALIDWALHSPLNLGVQCIARVQDLVEIIHNVEDASSVLICVSECVNDSTKKNCLGAWGTWLTVDMMTAKRDVPKNALPGFP